PDSIKLDENPMPIFRPKGFTTHPIGDGGKKQIMPNNDAINIAEVSKKSENLLHNVKAVDAESKLNNVAIKQALKAQVDDIKNKKGEHDLAKDYLARAGNKSGGSLQISEQAAALVNVQQSKPKYSEITKKN
ncbi:MAG TPA: hypothetical protein PKV52_03965, partial [Candidatus Saccharibacteria bacterium]|nr:hypothetical protein [Candidatus Saccharibacteria bacterium]